MGTSLAGKYKKSLAENWTLRFKTIHPDDDNYDGVVTHIKPDFIVIREKQDFEFDGAATLNFQSILRIAEVKKSKPASKANKRFMG